MAAAVTNGQSTANGSNSDDIPPLPDNIRASSSLSSATSSISSSANRKTHPNERIAIAKTATATTTTKPDFKS
eukprot:10407973-Ditylum_brightwellii.AAC.1